MGARRERPAVQDGAIRTGIILGLWRKEVLRSMGYAEDIKRAVTMRQVADLYGLTVNHAGFACCPFHHEKTPSFKIYEGSRGYYCFGCGRSGDVIRFVEEMDGCGFSEACAKLNRSFSLGLKIGEGGSRREAQEAARRAFLRRKQREAVETALEGAETAFWEAYDAWLMNLLTIEKNVPKQPTEPFSEAYAAAVAKAPILEWELEQAEIKRNELREKRCL